MRNGTRGQAKEVDRRVGGGWRPAQLSRHKRQGQKRAGQMTEKREREREGWGCTYRLWSEEFRLFFFLLLLF